jgi:hypothetical protein
MKRFKVKVDPEISENVEKNIWKLEWTDQQKLIADAIGDNIDPNSIEAFQSKHDAGFLYFAIKDWSNEDILKNFIKADNIKIEE